MIEFNQIISNDDYRQRVIKFFRLPMRLSVTKEKFLSDLDFIQKTDKEKYEMIINYTEKDFNTLVEEQGTTEPDFTMEDILDPLLDSIEKRPEWKEFMEKDFSNVLDGYDGIKKVSDFYKEENDGKNFISVDLTAANWQSLQNILGFNESYEEIIVEFTDNLIPPISKTFRTKITGILGAKNIMLYNKKLLSDNRKNILETILDYSGIDLTQKSPFAFYADEFLIEISDETLNEFNSLDLSLLESRVFQNTGIKVHLTPFKLEWLGVNKACAKIYKEDFEIINVSKDILLIMNKVLTNGFVKINDIDFEGVKLNGSSKEEFIEKIEDALEGKY